MFHDNDSRHNRAGFPDLVLLRPPELLFIELKSARGRIAVDQHLWIDQLGQVDYITADVVRPDRADDLIRRLLARTPPPDPHEAAQALDDYYGERS